jgi:hypothetical protein
VTVLARSELIVFALDRFGARFDGRIAGAVERAESGGALRVLEALVVGRDEGTGEVTVLRAKGGTGGLLPALTAFRLDPRRPAEAGSGVPGDELADTGSAAVRQLSDELRAGEGVVALRLEHRWAATLGDAVAGAGGRLLADEPAEPAPPEDLAQRALEVARRELRAGTAGGGS